MLEIGIIGAGARGWSLARSVAQHTDRARVAAVADPVASHRDAFGEEHSMAAGRRFRTHTELLAQCPDLDGVLITSPVPSHADIACDCLEAGISVFLDKPMALHLDEAQRIVSTAARTGTRLQVGFNLRYAPFFVALKEAVASGKLGEVLSVEWKEALAASHWAEYCRHPTYNRRSMVGSWLLEKCCHDIDILNWIVGARCVRVASFGSRSFFKPRPDVPERCTPECPIEKQCIFAAAKLYGSGTVDDTGRTRVMPHVCVYHSGADLVDRQTAILEYDNAVTVAFSLLPLSPADSRLMRVCGSVATLRGCSANNELRVHPYATDEEIVCDPTPVTGGHGGADPQVVAAFLDWLNDPALRPATVGVEGLEAMVVCEGIDLAMREHRVVELADLRH